MLNNILLIFLLVSFSVYAKKPPKQPPPPSTPQCTTAGWCKQGTVAGVTGNYTPVMIVNGSIRVYGNSDDNTAHDGGWFLRTGTWSSVGTAINIEPVKPAQDDFTRTSAVARGISGMYYGILYTGPCYGTGCVGGFSPSFITSPDGYAWTWHGMVSPWGRNQSSASAIIVDEPVLRVWLDIPGGLFEMWSNDYGTTWQSNNLNIWPIPNEQPLNVTAAKDSQGHIHLLGANQYPATAIRHVVLCHGQYPAKVISLDAGIGDPTIGKGTNVTYDPAINIMHALTSGTHWTWQVTNVGC